MERLWVGLRWRVDFNDAFDVPLRGRISLYLRTKGLSVQPSSDATECQVAGSCLRISRRSSSARGPISSRWSICLRSTRAASADSIAFSTSAGKGSKARSAR